MDRAKTIKPTRLFWSLVLGLGLALALLWALMPRSAAEAQAIPGFSLEPFHSQAEVEAPVGDGEPVAVAGSGSTADKIALEPPARAAPPAFLRYDPSIPSLEARARPAVATSDGGRSQPLAARPGLERATGLQAASPAITVSLLYNNLWGYSPHTETTLFLTLKTGTAVRGWGLARTDDLGYFQSADFWSQGRQVDIAGGDTVYVSNGSLTTTIEVPTITGAVDVVNDIVSGTITGVANPVSLIVRILGERRVVSTDGVGDFSADFSTFDIFQEDWVEVIYEDGNGNRVVMNLFPQDGFTVYDSWDSVSGYTAPGRTVTVTVRDELDTVKMSGSVESDATDGSYTFSGEGTIDPSDEVGVDFGAGPVTATVSSLTASIGLGTDTVSGTGPSNSTLRVLTYRRAGITSRLYTELVSTGGDGTWSAAFSGFTFDRWDRTQVYHAGNEHGDTHIYQHAPIANVNITYDNIGGYAGPEATVTATLRTPTATREEVAVETQSDGYFLAEFSQDVAIGDILDVVGGGLSTTIPVESMTVDVNLAADLISGQAPASSPMIIQGWRDRAPFFREWTASSGGATYSLDVSGYLDLYNGYNGHVYYSQADGHKVFLHYHTPIVHVNQTDDGLWGYVAGPFIPVTVTVREASGALKASAVVVSKEDNYFQAFYDGSVDILPGDIVEVTTAPSVTVVDLDVTIDAEADVVTGYGPAHSLLHVQVWDNDEADVWVPTGGDGVFRLDLSGQVDLRAGDSVRLGYEDGNHNEIYIWRAAPYARANQTWDAVDGQFGPGVTVVFTVTDRFGAYKGGNTGTARPDGWLDGMGCDCDIVPTDLISVTSDAGLAARLEMITITGQIDVISDVVSGQMAGGLFPASGNIRIWSNARHDGYWMRISIDASGFFTADFSGEFDIWPGDEADVWYYDPNGNQLGTMLYTPFLEIQVNYGHDWVEARTMPFATVALTLADSGGIKASLTGQAEGDSWFRSWQWEWVPEQPDIQPGDVVTVSTVGLVATVNPIGTIEGVVDADADSISGAIQANWFTQTLHVRCEVWEWGAPGIETTVDPDGGEYSCDFSGIWDILPAHNVAVRYYEPDGDQVINVFSAPWMRVNYAHDWVGANYPTGHTFWITVTGSGGVVKATSVLSTTPDRGWGGEGFETDWWQWSPMQPDIGPGDWVYARSDDGYSNAIQVGTITGTVDVDGDSVSGNVYATWFTRTLTVECHPWGAPGPAPSKESSAEPDGSVPYFCQWNPNTEWDILPGQEAAVMYLEPDGDRVIDVYYESAPDARVEKWVEGNEVAPGGPVIFTIRYRNEGNALAQTILLTDTLPANTTYLTDSSGFPANVGNGQVTWTLGPLAPDEEKRFQLVLAHTAGPGETLRNTVDIYTLYDREEWNNHAEAEAWVTGGQPDLYIDKGVEPGDPTPGETFVYRLHYSNNGPVASGPVLLTDTLPPGTSVVSWHSEEGYELWAEVPTGGDQFVLAAPTIPGYWGDEIRLRLQLEPGVPLGTQLTNTVQITTPNDSDSGDNFSQNTNGWVSPPRWDVRVNKDWSYGQLVPGGQINYHIDYRNDGNSTAHDVWLTDILPAGTSLVEARLEAPTGDVPFPPDSLGAGQVAWNLGDLSPWAEGDIRLRLQVDPGITPPMVITNQVTIATSDPDDWPNNNTAVVVETVNPPGPNLRVQGRAEWNWEGQLEYRLRVENIGTTLVQSVTVTATYPISTNFDGNWWHNYWRGIDFTHNAAARQLVWTLERLEAGETTGLNFNVDLDGAIVGQQGLSFTGQAWIDTPAGEVTPEDNSDTVVSYTGPDVYVKKWLSGGEPRAGEIVTFTVAFGNRNQWPWSGDPNYGSHITDTLPPEMEFITATAPSAPGKTWMPNQLPGNVLEWDWGTMWHDNTWYFDIVARITDTADIGAVITNVIEAYGDSPADIEPIWDNNVFELPMTIHGPEFEIGKVYQSSRVAGTSVTYTLIVTNTGNETATGVIVSDTVPAHLSNVGSAGTLNFGWLWWYLGPITPGGGTATAQFSATLPCTAGSSIVNDDYGVRGSEQGMSGPAGAPVSFSVLAPTLEAAFSQSAITITIGDTLYFTDTSTTNGPPLAAWEWDFGDNSAHTFTRNASHSYTSEGAFTVRLTVTDTCGYSDVQTATVTVQAACVPVTGLTFAYAPMPVSVGQATTFTATYTGGDPAPTFAWSFDGGAPASGRSIIHTFATPGTHTVALTATNTCGSVSYSRDVSVEPRRVYLPLVMRNLKPASVVSGSVEIEDGRCCVGGTVGEDIGIRSAFSASSLAGEVTGMRTLARYGGGRASQEAMEQVSWETYVPEKVFTITLALNWIGFYVSAQYRDESANTSPIYCDDISVEGMPPPPGDDAAALTVTRRMYTFRPASKRSATYRDKPK